MPKAFENITVVDFSQVLAGPFATQQLAFLGANVIKVEPPGKGEGGRHIRATADMSPENMSSVFLCVNAGKRSMTLDLKHPRAAEVVRRLVSQADVVVQNFKVGVIDRLGFGYEAVRAINQSIVYCSISGYGQEGPNATAAAYDPAVQGASGLMQLIGTPDSGPLRTGFPLVDMSTGLTAAIAIMGALYRRRETGDGQFLDVAMMDSAMSLAAYPYMQFQQTGQEPERLGNGSQLRTPTADVLETGDGHIQITALTDRQIQALVETVGLPDLLADERFSTADVRTEHSEDMRALLLQAFASKSAREWESELAAAGVPASAVLRLPEALVHEQQQHRNFLQMTQPQGIAEPIRVFNAAYGATVDGPEIQRPPPAVGEHTNEVLAEFGFSQGEIDGLQADNAL